MELNSNKTERGFAHIEFIDRYGAKCSLQKSSLASKHQLVFRVYLHRKP